MLHRELHLDLRAAERASRRVERVRPLYLVEHRGLDVARSACSEELGRDAKGFRNRTVRLLASTPVRVGEFDQSGPQQHAHVEVQMTGIDTQALCELAVRELPLALLSEHLEDAHPQRVPQCLQLLRLVEYQRLSLQTVCPLCCRPGRTCTYSGDPVKPEAWLLQRDRGLQRFSHCGPGRGWQASAGLVPRRMHGAPPPPFRLRRGRRRSRERYRGPGG